MNNLQAEAILKILNAHIAGTLLTCFILDCTIASRADRPFDRVRGYFTRADCGTLGTAHITPPLPFSLYFQ
jgi:hypothetical protein